MATVPMRFVGIDPGKSGGIVALSEHGALLFAARTPLFRAARQRIEDEHEMVRALREAIGDNAGDRCAAFVGIERVAAMPGQGVSSMFSFGANYGLWRGMLAALCLGYTLVSPRDWQRNVEGLRSGLSVGERKAKIAAAAARRWPDLDLRAKASWGMADAAWIAEHVRRVSIGKR